MVIIILKWRVLFVKKKTPELVASVSKSELPVAIFKEKGNFGRIE